MHIDAFAFCRNGEQQSGALLLSALPRLRAECTSDEGQINWMLVGTVDSVQNTPHLHLTVHGSIPLQCQRCLTPYEFHVQSEASILLAKDEDAADQLDTLLQDNDIEVIVGSKALDVIELIEDEALLAIPLSPKHEACPSGEIFDDVPMDEDKDESPFAILKDQLVVGKVGKSKKTN